MTRQACIRVLLSLLLLIAQHMAVSHAMSHWSAALGGARGPTPVHQGDSQSELSRALALHQSCDQCLGFAQLAGPLPSTPRAFAAPDMAAILGATTVGQPACARTVCVFRSRAPPQA